jgi:hypothetical protein
MKPKKTVEVVSESGDSINIPLAIEGEREGAMLIIDGVRYHFERITKEQLVSEYRVDDDPNYQPQTDADGYCYVLAPFSK